MCLLLVYLPKLFLRISRECFLVQQVYHSFILPNLVPQFFQDSLCFFPPFFCLFWWDWGLTQGFVLTKQILYAWATTPPVYFALVVLKMGSHELFAWADLKQQFYQFQPPKYLGLWAWATSAHSLLLIWWLLLQLLPFTRKGAILH
jgi:hypothetical protein